MADSDPELQDQLDALNRPTIEFFILADYAEAVNGKLYMVGGGWDRMRVTDFSQPVGFSFAIGIQVPWNATNIRQTVRVTIQDVDGLKPIGFEMNASIVTGRPATISQGESQRTLIAIPKTSARFPSPGSYQAVATLSSGDERRVLFHLVQAPAAQVAG